MPVTATKTTARRPIAVRRSTYRGKAGWTVAGECVKVFFEHESAARRTAAKYRADSCYRCTVADFVA